MTIDIKDIALKNADERTLSNGIKLYVLPSADFEVLRVSFVFGAGSVRQSKPFQATTTANMLAEGSAEMSAQQIADNLDYYGSYYDVNIDRDYTYFSFCSLSKFVEPTLKVAREILLSPIFPEEELLSYAAKRKQRLQIEREKVETRAREQLGISLFGAEHPYGVSYPAEAYDDLCVEDLRAMYEEFYHAGNCIVVCSGELNDSVLTQIEALASALPLGEAPGNLIPQAGEHRPYFLEEREGAVQSSLRLAWRLFDRSHPDFLGMQVLATTLGGYFGSRLMQSLRERRGLTYGVMSAMVNFAYDGYFAIATQVGVESTREALSLIEDEVERLRTELIPREELEMVFNIITGEMMRILDGPFGVADVTIENILSGGDNSVIEKNVERMLAFTPAQLLALAQKHLSADKMSCVIIGALDDK